MTKKSIIFAIIGLIVALVLIIGVSIAVSFNTAIRNKNAALEKKALMAVALELRFDKLEELLNAVEGLEEHVEQQLTKITNARIALANSSADEIADDVDDITSGFNDILVLIENDPGVYIATSAYSNYMAEISATMNAVGSARIQYNQAVTKHNSYLETFPRNMYFKIFSFEKLPLYEPIITID
jgi:LemA protein